MSRSDHAQTLSFSKLRACAAVSCMLVLGCRFTTNPGDSIIAVDAGTEEAPASTTDDNEDNSAPPTRTSAVKNAAAVAKDAGDDPGDTADAATSDAGEPTAAASTVSDAGTAAAAGSSAPAAVAGASAPAAAGSPAPVAGSAGLATPPSAAGSLATPTLPTQSPKEAECSADLASCLLRDPLAYAECLRMNQDNGCPEPDAGVPVTTSPVTTEDGMPLSQACQAELANCIARLPTPENAASCTERARKCK